MLLFCGRRVMLPPGPGETFCLDWHYVFSLGTFLAVGDGELNFLAICQSLESVSLNGAEMNEDVGASFLLDKAEALCFVEPLNCAGYCRHILITCVAFAGPRGRRHFKKII